jgi:hypothetical protein
MNKEFNEPEDYFLTEEFKSLPLLKRIGIRLKVAFFMTISNF